MHILNIFLPGLTPVAPKILSTQLMYCLIAIRGNWLLSNAKELTVKGFQESRAEEGGL